MKPPSMRRARTARAVAACLVVGALSWPHVAARATDPPASPATDFRATPDLPCGPGDQPETVQGRVPTADYASGRAALGYTCNAAALAHVGASGGYRVYRYVDGAGHVCAFYDTALLFPTNGYAASTGLTGVWVLDMSDPSNPQHTATLSTPAMQSPHESLSFNAKRGLLGAVMANPVFYPGEFDLYDVRADCRHPALTATLPMGILGHEGSFTPDGLTYYASSLYGNTLAAIDVSNPLLPKLVWSSALWSVHGMNASDDGRTLYFADLGTHGFPPMPGSGTDGSKGLTVLDVSQVQDRVANPQVTVVSHVSWPVISTPQTMLPVTIGGHRYLVEVDEFANSTNEQYTPSGSVGAARIIDIADPQHPTVVSNMRLAVDNTDQRGTDQQNDPGANSGLQGYAGHYCGVPQEVDPGIVACSFIASGLRVFDIRDVQHPKEIAYFNQPPPTGGFYPGGQGGAYAMSQPAFDPATGQIWYSDGNTGFYAVHVTHGVWPVA